MNYKHINKSKNHVLYSCILMFSFRGNQEDVGQTIHVDYRLLANL
jgi:hypothetical protein